MTKPLFHSPTREKYGISCTEALKLGLITPVTKLKFVRDGVKSIQDGYECVITGLRYPTQEQAVEAHFTKTSQEITEQSAKNNSNLDLFKKFRNEIQELGFLTNSTREATNRVFAFEETICCKYENDLDRDVRISAYAGMIETLKNNEKEINS